MNSNITQTVRAKEAATYLGISYGKFLQLVREKKIPTAKAGNRILCRVSTLESWLGDQEMQSVISEHGMIRRIIE
jgi:excisionase family DNA binding protein